MRISDWSSDVCSSDLTLYGQNCASCHGMSGDGRGPDAARLDPPPIAFSDAARARERSVFGLYQVIEQGLDGTAMQSFADLPAADRWALAFYTGRRSDEHTSELQSLMRISYAVF